MRYDSKPRFLDLMWTFLGLFSVVFVFTSVAHFYGANSELENGLAAPVEEAVLTGDVGEDFSLCIYAEDAKTVEMAISLVQKEQPGEMERSKALVEIARRYIEDNDAHE
jgi:hypothetical protein